MSNAITAAVDRTRAPRPRLERAQGCLLIARVAPDQRGCRLRRVRAANLRCRAARLDAGWGSTLGLRASSSSSSAPASSASDESPGPTFFSSDDLSGTNPPSPSSSPSSSFDTEGGASDGSGEVPIAAADTGGGSGGSGPSGGGGSGGGGGRSDGPPPGDGDGDGEEDDPLLPIGAVEEVLASQGASGATLPPDWAALARSGGLRASALAAFIAISKAGGLAGFLLNRFPFVRDRLVVSRPPRIRPIPPHFTPPDSSPRRPLTAVPSFLPFPSPPLSHPISMTRAFCSRC